MPTKLRRQVSYVHNYLGLLYYSFSACITAIASIGPVNLRSSLHVVLLTFPIAIVFTSYYYQSWMIKLIVSHKRDVRIICCLPLTSRNQSHSARPTLRPSAHYIAKRKRAVLRRWWNWEQAPFWRCPCLRSIGSPFQFVGPTTRKTGSDLSHSWRIGPPSYSGQ